MCLDLYVANSLILFFDVRNQFTIAVTQSLDDTPHHRIGRHSLVSDQRVNRDGTHHVARLME